MATAKTGSFYLTETVTIPAASPSGTRVQNTIDLSAYVNVPTGQAIAIDQVDFIVQDGTAMSGFAGGYLTANGAVTYQLTDLNPGTVFIRADDHSLVSSGAMNIAFAENIVSDEADIYPDSFGPTNLSEMFLVVNDTLFLVAGVNIIAPGVVGGEALSVTVRIRARVVKLSTKDWMAIAIQSTASDN